jgi:putative restriction endonuclease
MTTRYLTKSWLLLSFGEDRQYGGNDGYSDELQRIYRYDSFVANHRQISEGSLTFIRDHYSLLGIAKIERIGCTNGTKKMNRCPQCRTTGLKVRKHLLPRFRCHKGHEFEEPSIEYTECLLYDAEFGNTFIPTPGALSVEALRAACLRPSDQLAIQEIDGHRLAARLVQCYPKAENLLSYLLDSQ